MPEVKSVATSAIRLGDLLTAQSKRLQRLRLSEHIIDDPDEIEGYELDILIRRGDLRQAAETIRLIEEFLQDGPPQRDELDYYYDSMDLFLGEEVLEPDLRNGGSFIVCPFGELCLGLSPPYDVQMRWLELNDEMTHIAALA